MMYLITGNGISGRPTEHHWHIGEPSPFKHNPDLAQFVSQVQADGDELDYVRKRFINLPMRDVKGTHGMVERWYGDHAKFIAGNL